MVSIIKSVTKCIKECSNKFKDTVDAAKDLYNDNLKEPVTRLQGCYQIFKNVKEAYSFYVSEKSGGLDTSSIISILQHSCNSWDSLSDAIDKALNKDKVLESLSKNILGEEVFEKGSLVKNLSTGIISLKDTTFNLIGSLAQDRGAQKFINFDNNYDKWAKSINNLVSIATSGEQKNILEFLAKENLGDKIFNLGSVLKKETSNILKGLETFKSGIKAFEGSYRNPVEAASKIKTGVDNIVAATEQLAKSCNRIVILVQSKGSMDGYTGFKGLTTLSNLHSNDLVSKINTTIRVGGGIVAVGGDGKDLIAAVKNKDIKNIYSSGKKLVDDVKALTKNNMKDGKPAEIISSKDKTTNKGSTSKNNIQNEEQKDNENSSNSNDDSYVCSGAIIKCSYGTSKAKLTVYPDRTVFLTGEPMANITDHISLYNIGSFGRCRTCAYPPTGSATAANHGTLTPMPCVPGTHTLWFRGKDDVPVKGMAALLKTSYCMCCYGGIIKIEKDGQKS